MHISIRIVALSVLLSASACSEKDVSIKSSRPEIMRELRVALTNAGMQFHVDGDGSIRFKANDQETVTRILNEVEQLAADGEPIRYEKELAVYLRNLLTTEGIKFSAEVRDDGEWIRWHAQSLQQQAEIDMKLAQYAYNLRRGKSPSPSVEEKAASKSSARGTGMYTDK